MSAVLVYIKAACEFPSLFFVAPPHFSLKLAVFCWLRVLHVALLANAAHVLQCMCACTVSIYVSPRQFEFRCSFRERRKNNFYANMLSFFFCGF